MKTLNFSTFRFVAFKKVAFLFVCIFQFFITIVYSQSSDPPPSGFERGMYVDCADVIIKELNNSNTISRDALIAYAQSRSITYMALFKLDVPNPTIVIRDVNLQDDLSAFIDYCKQQIPGLEIGIVISDKNYIDDIEYYNYGYINSHWPCAYINEPLAEWVNNILNPGEGASHDDKVVAEMARSMIDVKFYNDGIDSDEQVEELPIVQQSFLQPHSGKFDWISIEYEYWHTAKFSSAFLKYSLGQSYKNYLDLLEIGRFACCASGYTLKLESELSLIDYNNGIVSNYNMSINSVLSLTTMTNATTLIGSNNDNSPTTSSTPIGFDFKLNGTTYSDFSVSPDGWLLLGTTTATSQSLNAVASTTNTPKIYPYWDDLATGTDGSVQMLTIGNEPNRQLIVQWKVTIPKNTVGASNSTFEVILSEGSNGIEFNYGTMGASSMSASVGVTQGVSNFQSITLSSSTSSNTTANDANSGQPLYGTSFEFETDNGCKPFDAYHSDALLGGFPDGQQQANEIDFRLNRILLVNYTRFTNDLFHRQCHNYYLIGNPSTEIYSSEPSRVWPLFSVEFPNIGQQRCSGAATGCDEAFLGLFLSPTSVSATFPCNTTNTLSGSSGDFEDIENLWISQLGSASTCDHCGTDYTAPGNFSQYINNNDFDGFMWFTYSIMDQMTYHRKRADKINDPLSISVNYKLYPNPTTEEVNVKSINKKLHSIEIYNTLGYLIHKIKTISNEASFKINDVNGVYLVKVIFEDNLVEFSRIQVIKQ